MGWAPYVASWIMGLPEAVGGTAPGSEGPTSSRGIVLASAWRGMFEWMMSGALTFVRKSGLRLLVPLGDLPIVANVARVIDSFMDAVVTTCGTGAGEEAEAIAAVEGTFLFSLAWGIGGVLDTKGREALDTWIRTLLMSGESPEIPASARRRMTVVTPPGSLFEHSFTPVGRGRWVSWSTRVETTPAAPAGTTNFSNMVVPTVDTVKYGALLEAAVSRRIHFVFVGPTGTGKSVYIGALLSRQDKAKARVTGLSFSAHTSAAAVQDILESRMDNRRRNERGPPQGMVHLVFVDDLNMPDVEQFGAQPPLELLRQVIDSGGWYDRKELVFKRILDTIFLAAMAPPGGGRHQISGRVLRHFEVVGATPVSDASMRRIYGAIGAAFAASNGFEDKIKLLYGTAVDATLEVYTTMLTKFLPSPAKSHYTFNLRDFGRVIAGMMLCTSKTMGSSKEKFVRLWTHECVRVFSDRLVSSEDRNSFLGYIRGTVQRRFGISFDVLLANLDINNDGHIDTDVEARGLIFADFVSKDRSYDEVDMRAVIGGVVAALEGRSEATDAAIAGTSTAEGGPAAPNVVEVVQGFLDDYNAMSTKPMRLVLFMFAIEHVARICRILRIAGGHALLVGIGGSGRQSLTLLASFIIGADVVAVKTTKLYGATDWRDDLKRLLTRAGGEGKQTVFLLTDTQITMDLQLEGTQSSLRGWPCSC